MLHDEIIRFCRQAGFSPNIAQEAMPQETIIELVRIGVGITLIHRSAQTILRPNVVCRSLIEPTPEIEVAIAWHSDASNPLLPIFIETVKSVLNK